MVALSRHSLLVCNRIDGLCISLFEHTKGSVIDGCNYVLFWLLLVVLFVLCRLYCRVLQKVFETNSLPPAICASICTSGAIGFIFILLVIVIL